MTIPGRFALFAAALALASVSYAATRPPGDGADMQALFGASGAHIRGGVDIPVRSQTSV